MDLSGELRNKIYRSLYVLDRRIDLGGNIYRSSTRAPEYPHYYDVRADASSQVLRVSKQLYREGATILYGENRFYVRGPDDLTRVSHAAGGELAAFIKDLVICYSSRQRFGTFENGPFTRFTGLQKLVFLTAKYQTNIDDFPCPSKGDRVSRRNFKLLLEDHLPNFSRAEMRKLRASDGLDVSLEVDVTTYWSSIKDMEREGRYVYRIQPTFTESRPALTTGSTETDYDLVFVSTTADYAQ
ncbi:hypothetical protein FKW77_002594 [Venturia effusa]|uniref:Uncharacterized protein n=1 Tax=Venturia effusa TaxID=50376 RepID=A0A517LPQ7_9PEZI|nr:hypothetical protein FKW77_002594 [Venturia effusa]